MFNISILLVALFAFVLSTLAAPVPVDSTGLVKRITHSGRVSLSALSSYLVLMASTQGTWFDVGLGHCGLENVNSDPIVALSTARYGSGGNCEQVSSFHYLRHASEF